MFPSIIKNYHKTGARGAARLFTLLSKAANNEVLISVNTQHGVSIGLTPRHFIDTQVMRHGYYELEIINAVLDIYAEGDVFWDIGANIGLHSLTLKHLRPSSSVVAFEPNPNMVVRILSNAKRNNLSMQVIPGALWNQNTLADLSLSQEHNPGMATLMPGNTVDKLLIKASCLRGDDLVRMGCLPAPSIIKIDVEGSEKTVLDGMNDILQNRKLRAVIFEHGKQEPMNSSPANMLIELGFHVSKLTSYHSAQHDNYIATRE
jgi:FkbM family methyltransferase